MTNWLPDLHGRPGPRYRAIAEAMAEAIRSGTLATGTRLPTHRDLAWKLGVTVGTITRAYKEATARGLIDGEIGRGRSEEHTSELQSLMRISYAVFCLKKKKT